MASSPLFPTIAGLAGELTSESTSYALRVAETLVIGGRFGDAADYIANAQRWVNSTTTLLDGQVEWEANILSAAAGRVREHQAAHRAWCLGS